MVRNKKKISGAIILSLLLIVITALTQTIPPKVPRGTGSAGNKIDGDTAIEVSTNDDPWKEMDKIIAANNNSQGVSLSGTIKLIDDNGDKEKVLEEQSFEYSFLGVNIYQKIGSMEFISKPDLLLVADHDNKLIAVSNSGTGEDKANNLFDIKGFKKMMEERKASAKVTESGEQKLLTIENIQDPQIQGYRIYYDPETYKINKILIGMLRLSSLSDDESSIEEIPGSPDHKVGNNEEETGSTNDNEIEAYTYYLEIIYSEMKILGIKEDSFHPENKFIIKTKNKIELTTAFSKYHLVNNGVDENDEQNEPQQ
jgi:hypothetical protein